MADGGWVSRKRAVRAVGFAVLALAAVVLVRARLLPPPKPILVCYPAFGETGDARAVPDDTVFRQLDDLLRGGFSPVSPRTLRLRRLFGTRLPSHPFLLLVEDPLAGGGEAFTRILENVLGPLETPVAIRRPTDIPKPWKPALDAGLLTLLTDAQWEALRTNGIVTPASGGPHAFEAELLQDAVEPGFFGTLRFRHLRGEDIPLVLLVYEPDGTRPRLQADCPPRAKRAETRLAVPEDAAFPLEIVVYDATRTLLQFSTKIHRRDAIRAPGYRRPILPSSDRIATE